MILSIDIGGTAVKMGLVDRNGTIHSRHEAGVCFDDYKTPILATVKKEAQAFLLKEKAEVEGIGVSACGQIDDRTGVVIGTNGKIPGYEGSRIKDELEELFGVPVWVLNDANAAALGEAFLGGAQGAANAILLTLGTGVGGGIILNGKIFGGTLGIAGELGHFTLYQNGLPCTCGKRGSYENYAATTALVRRAKEATGETLDGRQIFARAEQGEKAMLAVLDAWIDDIAAGVTGLAHIFNPSVVLIGGGVSAQEELLIVPLRKKVLATAKRLQAAPGEMEKLTVKAELLKNITGDITVSLEEV